MLKFIQKVTKIYIFAKKFARLAIHLLFVFLRLMGYDKSYTHILMCGPTANVLVADLTKAGYRALDLGHLAKSYDWHKKGIDMSKSGDNVVKFFDPDE